MTKEETLQSIQSYIDDLKEYGQTNGLSVNYRQHIKRAIDEYKKLYTAAEMGKIDPEELHENITTFMYVLQ